jgi:hypothetical protein
MTRWAEFAGAIRRAAPLLRGQRLVVVAMWHSIEPAAGLARAAMPAGMVHVGVRNWNREQHERAHAQQAVAIAQGAASTPRLRYGLVAGGWATNVAGERGAEVIVLAHARRARRLARLLRCAQKDAGGPAQLLLGRRLTRDEHRSEDHRSAWRLRRRSVRMADVPAWRGVETAGMGHVSATRDELLARRAQIGLAGQSRGSLGERRAALLRESQRASAVVLEAMRKLERDAPSARRSRRSPHSPGS